MADQTSLQDQNQQATMMGASGTAGTAETRRIIVNDSGGVAVDTRGVKYATRVDDNGAGTTWVGQAVPGSNEGSAVWSITQIVDNSGTTDITWADGDSNADNVWTGHGTLSYS